MYIKKRIKFSSLQITVGDLAGARHLSWTYLALNDTPFTTIYKPISSLMMWQDPFLTQWEGAQSRDLLTQLEARHGWSLSTPIKHPPETDPSAVN